MQPPPPRGGWRVHAGCFVCGVGWVVGARWPVCGVGFPKTLKNGLLPVNLSLWVVVYCLRCGAFGLGAGFLFLGSLWACILFFLHLVSILFLRVSLRPALCRSADGLFRVSLRFGLTWTRFLL